MMTLVLAFDPFGILQGLSDALTGFVTNLINLVSQGILAPLQTLWSFLQSMPLAYTTQNSIVTQSWGMMTLVADSLLGLLVLIGTIQIMYGQTTRSLEMPLAPFVGRAILTALLIHMSTFFGETLLNLNNAIAGIAGANVLGFVTRLVKGNAFSTAQTALFGAIMLLVFAIGFLRLAMQAIKRIILFNLLFVLSGPAFLLSFHPYTQPVFSSWARRFVATGFEQSIQLLGLDLGFQFLQKTGQNGIIGFIIAIALMNLAIEIPSLVSHLVGGGPPIGLRDNSLLPVVVAAGKAAMSAF